MKSMKVITLTFWCNDQPSTILEPILEVKQLQSPEEFFVAFEKFENTQKELKRQRGGKEVDEIKELNSYQSTLGNKRVELFDMGAGVSEPMADDNAKVASEMSNQELLQAGMHTLNETDQAIERSNQFFNKQLKCSDCLPERTQAFAVYVGLLLVKSAVVGVVFEWQAFEAYVGLLLIKSAVVGVVSEWQEELARYATNDPAIFEAMKEAIKVAHEAANRWTDNIFTLHQWCSNNFPQAKEQVEHLYNEFTLGVVRSYLVLASTSMVMRLLHL
ncbi:hypothetical protein L2E82_47462 [Cichorium intybus]|uniref:Uncharacterized protein n=1 Tax=Cichorium intybus TaxID=13427 RepID=A0ACB8YW47_CICIN|nr:hypothetical protein L2E82_47462 [Cichorium intybus]